MKTKSNKLVPWTIAALCLTLFSHSWAADSTEKPGSSSGNQSATETNTIAGLPTAVNRASSLIGMDVRNQKDEHLGHIKDIVFDLSTERVSYAVITTAPKGLPFINEKLLAVPLNALTPDPENKHLILRADKSQMEAASGIEKDNWPSVSNPSWGAQPFWQNTGGINDSTTNTPEQAPKMEMKDENP